jgi:adenylosuccinate lyase
MGYGVKDSISPLDGRYSSDIEELLPFFSEKALIRYRLMIEVEYLIALSEEKII